MLTAAGSGYSRWRGIALTRWREDVTCDGWGSYVFLRDAQSGKVWSAGHQPSGAEADSYDVAFSEGRAEIVRLDGSLRTSLEVAVSPENDAEVRRVSIANLGSRAREIELTSYAEVVLAPHLADLAHPAFSKLFVQTEWVTSLDAILATRRRRTQSEPEVWAAHLAVEAIASASRSSRPLARVSGSRRRKITDGGDGWTATDRHPRHGPDPIFSVRRRLRIHLVRCASRSDDGGDARGRPHSCGKPTRRRSIESSLA